MRKSLRQRQHNDKQRRLIVGGHNIEQGRYPYFVSVEKDNGVVVNGVLIAPDIVLSAGHIALDHMDNLSLKVGPFAVHETEDFAEDNKVEEWIVPSSWSEFAPTFFRNDYIILKLAEKSTHKPVRINRDPAVPNNGETVVMAGLGWLNESYLSPASIVQEVELVAVDSKECEATADPSRNMTYQGKIDESMLCTKGPPNTTRDGCAWDSGAPVIVAGKTPETDILVGLGSTGVACADPVFPAIQARVASEFGLSWIRQQVCQLSVDPPMDFHCGTINATVTTTPPPIAASFMPLSSPSAFSTVGSGASPALALAGCLLALLALLVGRRAQAKLVVRMEQVVLSNEMQRPVAYGAIDC